MHIEQRKFGDVTVLDLEGRIAIGEGEEPLREAVRRLLDAGERKLVLNLSRVQIIDSSGLGALCRFYVTVTGMGGALVLTGPSERLKSILSFEKALTVLVAGRTVEEAVAEFDSAGLEVSCPACETELWMPLRGPAHGAQDCPECLIRFGVSAQLAHLKTSITAGNPSLQNVSWLRLPTYKREHILVSRGRPFRIIINSRLDLFASEIVEKAWRILPLPRRVIFEIGYGHKEFTRTGLAKLLELCNEWTSDARAVVEKAWGMSAELTAAIGDHPRVHDSDSAIEALADGVMPAPIQVSIRKSS